MSQWQEQDDHSGAKVNVRIDSPDREGLTGTTPADTYSPMRDPEMITRPPDGRPLHHQPQWRKDFPIDWPQDHYVARRDFAKFLCLTSLAFAIGQLWIGMHNIWRRQRGAPPMMKVASLSTLSIGGTLVFRYPGPHDDCVLIRTSSDQFLAYSQKCTHLSCAVIPDVKQGVIRCPCHEGLFDLSSGNNLAGPPQRPLPRINLTVRGNDIYATGVERRTTI
jgi:nitrite reductase/ring-hydroxylating ferredoxin subunit